jgi:hypothetical protein
VWAGYWYGRLQLSTLQLTSLTHPTGAVTTLQYSRPAQSIECFDYSCERYNHNLAPYVSSITVDHIGGGAHATSYAYTVDSYGFGTQTAEGPPDGSKHMEIGASLLIHPFGLGCDHFITRGIR